MLAVHDHWATCPHAAHPHRAHRQLAFAVYYVLAEAYGASNVVGGPLGEMRGLREDGTRPADILVTDRDDTSIAVDVVVASPFTASLPVQREYASRPGLPARRAEDRKFRRDYRDSVRALVGRPGMRFVPCAVDEFGRLAPHFVALLREAAASKARLDAARRTAWLARHVGGDAAGPLALSVRGRAAELLTGWVARISWAVHSAHAHGVTAARSLTARAATVG